MDNTIIVNESGEPLSPKLLLDIPVGFLELVERTEQGERLIRVPKFWMDHYLHERGAYRKKVELGVNKQSNGNGIPTPHMETTDLTRVRLNYPANPDFSHHERLNLHAEVLALQERLGISYKDACHRLYLAELERNKTLRESLSVVREMEARAHQAACFLADSQSSNVKEG